MSLVLQGLAVISIIVAVGAVVVVGLVLWEVL